jgi:hypothetical protein
MAAEAYGGLILLGAGDHGYHAIVNSHPEERKWVYDPEASPHDDSYERVIYEALRELGYEPKHHAWAYPRCVLQDGDYFRGFMPDYTVLMPAGEGQNIEIHIEVTSSRKRAGHRKVSRIKRVSHHYGIGVLLATREIVNDVRREGAELLEVYLECFVEEIISSGLTPTRLAIAA